jgi:hypothetical protein
MELVQPGPFAPNDARRLAWLLLEDRNLASPDRELCAEAVADTVGHVAFYVHRLVSRLPRAITLTPVVIEETLNREITADRDDWDFAHYRNRLGKYYGEGERAALHILDAIAVGQPLNFQQIRSAVSAQMPIHDDESLRSLLGLLCRDHYLSRTSENGYRFYLDLIRRWWRFNRSL